jgi:precorrin-2 methylase
MITLSLIGIGTGNPDHVTGQAIHALNGADLVLLPRKGDDKSDLADIRRQILSRVLTRAVPVAEYDVPSAPIRLTILVRSTTGTTPLPKPGPRPSPRTCRRAARSR